MLKRLIQKFILTDGTQDLVLDSEGNVPIIIQDQHTELVDLYLTRDLGTVTLASNRSIGDTTFDLVAGHGAVVGNLLCLKEAGRHVQVTILVVATNTITIDSPLEFAFTTAAVANITDQDLATLSTGTLAVPILYTISPPVNVSWDIVRIMVYIEDATAMDDGLFGGTTALTNGIVLRVKNGMYKNIFNIKTNGDFAQRAYDRTYITKPPAGTGHSMVVRCTFGGQDKNGVVLRLIGATDQLQVLIQDDLTALSHFHVIAQGHTLN